MVVFPSCEVHTGASDTILCVARCYKMNHLTHLLRKLCLWWFLIHLVCPARNTKLIKKMGLIDLTTNKC